MKKRKFPQFYFRKKTSLNSGGIAPIENVSEEILFFAIKKRLSKNVICEITFYYGK